MAYNNRDGDDVSVLAIGLAALLLCVPLGQLAAELPDFNLRYHCGKRLPERPGCDRPFPSGLITALIGIEGYGQFKNPTLERMFGTVPREYRRAQF
jgi:hypothetical protein